MQRLTFSLPEDLRNRINRAAAADKRKPASTVRLLLEKHFADEDAAKKRKSVKCGK